MLLQINFEAEEKAIVTILEGTPDISALMLSKVTEDDFGSPEFQQCIIRINSLIKNNHSVPGIDAFSEDVALGDDAKTVLKETHARALAKPEDVNSIAYTLQLHKKYRRLLSGLKAVNRDIKEESLENLDKPIEDLEKLLLSLRSEQSETKLVVAGAGDTAYADELISKVLSPDDTESRIYTGFGYFDKLCGGFRKPSVVVISGTTGGGKSVMRTQLCKNMYMDQHLSTCIVSMEMSGEEEIMRLLSNISQVPVDKISRHQLSGTQIAKVQAAWNDFKKVGEDHDARFIIWPPQGTEITATQIVSYLKPLKLDVIVIDYIGLLSVGGKNDDAQWQALGDMVREFKVASTALNCCFIILAQFDGDNMRIKYSRAIQEHANILWGWTYGEKEAESGIVTIRQIKNRSSLSNIDFRLQFKLETMTIEDYAGNGDYSSDEKPISMPSKPQNSPPKDFKSMKKDMNSYSKQHTYKPAVTPPEDK